MPDNVSFVQVCPQWRIFVCISSPSIEFAVLENLDLYLQTYQSRFYSRNQQVLYPVTHVLCEESKNFAFSPSKGEKNKIHRPSHTDTDINRYTHIQIILPGTSTRYRYDVRILSMFEYSTPVKLEYGTTLLPARYIVLEYNVYYWSWQ
jgi:hypothetical protein